LLLRRTMEERCWYWNTNKRVKISY